MITRATAAKPRIAPWATRLAAASSTAAARYRLMPVSSQLGRGHGQHAHHAEHERVLAELGWVENAGEDEQEQEAQQGRQDGPGQVGRNVTAQDAERQRGARISRRFARRRHASATRLQGIGVEGGRPEPGQRERGSDPAIGSACKSASSARILRCGS